MPFLKKVAKAVASGSPVAARKSSGMSGTISKLLQKPGVKESLASGTAAPAAASRKSSLAGSGMMGNRAAVAKAAAAPRGGSLAGTGMMGNRERTFQKGGEVDKAGRALGKKTADAKGRAMATTPMKKGGMAKKSSKKC
jgi:hypothetical protein